MAAPVAAPVAAATVIAHMYNEEYLLPFWLRHHLPMFQHGIIIDYASTDRSVEIVKEICPTWVVIQSRNDTFDLKAEDAEVMDIETTIPAGFKITLTIAEFLVVDSWPMSVAGQNLKIQVFAALGSVGSEPADNAELFSSIEALHKSCRFGHRFMHECPHGMYQLGRHVSNRPSQFIDTVRIIWFGIHPWNSKQLLRKQQMVGRIPAVYTQAGAGSQHEWNLDQWESYRAHKLADAPELVLPETIGLKKA